MEPHLGTISTERAQTPAPRRWALLTGVILLAAVALGLALGEGMARLAHVPVFRVREAAYIGWAKPDPVLGWRNNPGTYPADEAPHEPMTFLPDGSRYTGPAPADGPAVLIVGCSYAEGYGVRDDQAFAALLQKRFPNLRIKNYAAPGYGTYQSLLVLREAVVQRHIHPAAIIYGFLPMHADRNVLTDSMLEAFRGFGGRRFSPPHVEWANGRLETFPPFVVPDWPLEEHSALITLAHQAELRVKLAGREKNEAQATLQLMEEMKAVADGQKAPLLVATLWDGPPPGPEVYAAITRGLERDGIQHVNVTYHGSETQPDKLRVGGTGHPGVAVHAWWADHLAEWLAAQHR